MPDLSDFSILVPGDGPIPCDFLGLGQGPGRREIHHHPPRCFIGPAGKELSSYLNQVGMHRENIFLTNAYKCFITDNKGKDREPTVAELESHWPILEDEINAVQPKMIACFGGTATRWMMRKAGLEYKTLECHHGMPVGYYKDILLFSTSHPAAGIHATEQMKVILADFQNMARVYKRVLRGQPVELPTDIYKGKEDYRRITSVDEFLEVISAYPDAPYMGLDTEGTRRDPIMLQFSLQAGTGYAVYSEDKELVELFRDWLISFTENGGIILLHNALYDLSVLRSMDIYLPDNSFRDTMIASFELGIEPQGLKPLAHRIAGMDMQSYEEQIHDKSDEIAMDYLVEAATRNWPDSEERLIRKGNDLKIYKPQSINKYIERILRDWSEQYSKTEHIAHIEVEETSKKGVTKLKRHTHDWYVKKYGHCPEGCHDIEVERDEPLDVRARWEHIDEDVKAPVEKELGRMREATLRDIEEARALAYATRDPDATLRVGIPLLKRVRDLDLDRVYDIDMAVVPIFDEMQRVGIPADIEHFVKFGEYCQSRMDQLQYEIYQETGFDININSGPQLSQLLFGELKLPSVRWTESGDRLATDSKALEPLRFLHPVVAKVLDFKEYSTLKSNFAVKLPRFVREDGRVHCKWKLTRVPTGRVATSDPNIMAMPTRSEEGKQVRCGFKAPEGYSFVTADQSGIELCMEAHASGDKTMCEMLNEGIDLHSHTAAWMFNYTMDEVIKGKKAGDQRFIDARFAGKTVNFGIVNLIGGMGLLDQFKLNNLAANPWAPNTTYIDDAECQSMTGECKRFKALVGGHSGSREPEWDRSAGGITQDGEIIWQECGKGWTEDSCTEAIAKWFGQHPGVESYHEKVKSEARRYGYVRDIFGRLRYSPEIRSNIAQIRETGIKEMVNHTIQSPAQICMKIGLAELWKQIKSWRGRGLDVQPLAEIHDEVIQLAPTEAVEEVGTVTVELIGKRVKELVRERYGIEFRVPIKGEWAASDISWGDISK